MSSSIIELALLAAIAAFVGWRLYTTLGSDNGSPDGRARSEAPAPRPVGEAQKRPAETNLRPAFTGPAAAGLEAIHAPLEVLEDVVEILGVLRGVQDVDCCDKNYGVEGI